MRETVVIAFAAVSACLIGTGAELSVWFWAGVGICVLFRKSSWRVYQLLFVLFAVWTAFHLERRTQVRLGCQEAWDRIPDTISGQVLSVHDGRTYLNLQSPCRGTAVLWGEQHTAGELVRGMGILAVKRGYRVEGAVDQVMLQWSRGIDFTVVNSALEKAGEFSMLRRWLHEGQSTFRSEIKRLFYHKAFVQALGVGERRDLPKELRERFQKTGTSHLLAVSGLHLSLVCGLTYLLFFRIWGRSPFVYFMSPMVFASVCAVAAGAWFCLVSGGRVSTVRALIVAFVYFGARCVHIRLRFSDAIVVAVVVILLRNPIAVIDASFVLSFTAVWGISMMPSSSRRIRQLAKVSIVAVVLSLPMLIAMSPNIPWVSPLANVVAVPLVSFLILPFVLVAPWIAVGSEFLAHGCAWLTDFFVYLLLQWLGFLEFIPNIQVWRPLSGGEIAASTLLGLTAITWATKRGQYWKGVAVAFVMFGGWHAGHRVMPQDSRLKIEFLDVGQGDATLVQFPNGTTWLFDTGGDVFPRPQSLPFSDRTLLPVLRNQGIDVLDRVVITHWDKDHYQGLESLFKDVHVRQVMIVFQAPLEVEGKSLLWEMTTLGTRVVYPSFQERIGEVTVRWLWPRYGGQLQYDPLFSKNGNSLVARLEYGGRAVLLTGDMDAEAEEELIGTGAALKADVVKVPHHGSHTSSSLSFVEAVRAKYAVVSSGFMNRFGHPKQSVLNRWRGANVFQTRIHGTISLRISSGGSISMYAMDSVE